MGEDCQHCHVLSSPSFDLCPYCGRPKGGYPYGETREITENDYQSTASVTVVGGGKTANEVTPPGYAGQFTALTEQSKKRPWWRFWNDTSG